jgi:division protein CdvB (Snf7/Vps24/ESCRT-III family)
MKINLINKSFGIAIAITTSLLTPALSQVQTTHNNIGSESANSGQIRQQYHRTLGQMQEMLGRMHQQVDRMTPEELEQHQQQLEQMMEQMEQMLGQQSSNYRYQR